jgi:hypothetical protein
MNKKNVISARGDFLKKMGDVFLNLFVVFAAAFFVEAVFGKLDYSVEKLVLGGVVTFTMFVVGAFLYRKGGKAWI